MSLRENVDEASKLLSDLKGWMPEDFISRFELTLKNKYLSLIDENSVSV